MSEHQEHAAHQHRPLPERNPITHRKHRHEVFWQITIPLVVGVILILALASLAVFSAFSGNSVGEAADISLILLISQALIIGLVLLLFNAGMVYLFYKTLKVLPPYFRIAQDGLQLFKQRVGILTDALVEPFLRAHSASASTRALGRSLRKR